MTSPENQLERRALAIAFVISLTIHGLLLFINNHPPKQGGPLPRIQASLARQPLPVKIPELRSPEPPKEQAKKPDKQQARPRVIATPKSLHSTPKNAPKFTVAEKPVINDFRNELASKANTPPVPTLAQRSLAMARDDTAQMAQQEKSDLLRIERHPNSPEPEPFSLELYFEGLLKNLNRSSAYVKNDPRSKGLQPAAVQFRVNPDGTLQSFTVLNAADQGEEIAFIKAVVERAAPFSPFPPDLNRSVKSMAVKICILPTRSGGFGFSKAGDGQGC